ncbi:hypothetical protein BGW80DRAFT_1286441 [Lactifluus volemus]|nr:hypothetical protein BGW80DRAFT_1286441 [Lactifluus volemus]
MLLAAIAVLSGLSDLSETARRVILAEARCPREGCLRSSGVVLRRQSGWPRLGIFHVISTQVAKKVDSSSILDPGALAE